MFPLASVAVHVTLVTPSENPPPGALLLIFGLLSTRSVAVAVLMLTIVKVPVESTCTSAGATIVGAVVSETATSCIALAVTPVPSCTVQLTTVVPRANPPTGVSSLNV
jgi:hypothetical protein